MFPWLWNGLEAASARAIGLRRGHRSTRLRHSTRQPSSPTTVGQLRRKPRQRREQDESGKERVLLDAAEVEQRVRSADRASADGGRPEIETSRKASTDGAAR